LAMSPAIRSGAAGACAPDASESTLMIHRLGHGILLALWLAWPAAPLRADAQVRTDANLITALDVSDSMMRHDQRVEFEGLAKALVHPAVLAAIAAADTAGSALPYSPGRAALISRLSCRGP
jgi:Protein of unknown function (DUF1194)